MNDAGIKCGFYLFDIVGRPHTDDGEFYPGFTQGTVNEFPFFAGSGFFLFTSDEDDPLIARKIDFSDNVTPSSNSSLATGLFKLSKYFYSEDFETAVKKLVLAMKESMFKSPAFHANWLNIASYLIYPYFEVAVVGDNFELFRKEISQRYLPNISVLGGSKNVSLELLNNKYVNGSTIIYVCEDKVCQLPVEEVAAAMEQITAK